MQEAEARRLGAAIEEWVSLWPTPRSGFLEKQQVVGTPAAGCRSPTHIGATAGLPDREQCQLT